MNGANGKAAVGMADVRGDAHMSQAHCYLDTVKLDVGVPAEHKHMYVHLYPLCRLCGCDGVILSYESYVF
eukprot:m.66374 g.66374  ORF g.66374 m.66374 type:complete len:70 (+) comp8355_c0_seq2:83-292(+)